MPTWPTAARNPTSCGWPAGSRRRWSAATAPAQRTSARAPRIEATVRWTVWRCAVDGRRRTPVVPGVWRGGAIHCVRAGCGRDLATIEADVWDPFGDGRWIHLAWLSGGG